MSEKERKDDEYMEKGRDKVIVLTIDVSVM